MKEPVQIKMDRTVAMLMKLNAGQVMAPIMREMDRQNMLTVAHCQEKKLSHKGPETLGVVTGKLRQSIKPIQAYVNGINVMSGIGSNLTYAAPHEFGFTGDVQVPQYWRKPPATYKGEKLGKRRSGAHSALVKGHSRKVRIKERAYVRRSITERKQQYEEGLRNAVLRALRGN